MILVGRSAGCSVKHTCACPIVLSLAAAAPRRSCRSSRPPSRHARRSRLRSRATSAHAGRAVAITPAPTRYGPCTQHWLSLRETNNTHAPHKRRDLLYLDLALESNVRQAAERGSGAVGFGAAALMAPLLQNLCLSLGDNEEACFCLKAWQVRSPTHLSVLEPVLPRTQVWSPMHALLNAPTMCTLPHSTAGPAHQRARRRAPQPRGGAAGVRRHQPHPPPAGQHLRCGAAQPKHPLD